MPSCPLYKEHMPIGTHSSESCQDAILLFVTGVLNIVNNIILILMLPRVKNFPETTSRFLYSLSVSDFVGGVLLILSADAAYRENSLLKGNDILCWYQGLLYVTMIDISSLTHGMLAVHAVIVHLGNGRLPSRKRTDGMVAGSWFFTIAMCLSRELINLDKVYYAYCQKSYFCIRGLFQEKSMRIGGAVIFIVVPCLLCLVCYSVLLWAFFLKGERFSTKSSNDVKKMHSRLSFQKSGNTFGSCCRTERQNKRKGENNSTQTFDESSSQNETPHFIRSIYKKIKGRKLNSVFDKNIKDLRVISENSDTFSSTHSQSNQNDEFCSSAIVFSHEEQKKHIFSMLACAIFFNVVLFAYFLDVCCQCITKSTFLLNWSLSLTGSCNSLILIIANSDFRVAFKDVIYKPLRIWRKYRHFFKLR